MSRTFLPLILLCATFLVALPTASAVTMAWSPVGNPGNASDSTGYGAVGHSYNIGTYDVTNSQYVEFLNSNVPGGETADPLALYDSNMSIFMYGGITYNAGAASGNKYSVVSGRGNNPVNFVTFYSTLRFANWLNNAQVAGATETGAYTLLGGTPTPSNGSSITRNAGATVFLPSENEWYKAAYYNPATSSYFQYPTSSNTVPTASSPTATPNRANFTPGGANTLTAVGAYSGTTSPSGAYDMGGNIFQWNEALVSSSTRGIRGGAFDTIFANLLSSNRGNDTPTDANVIVGFRVASVPEPSTLVLAALGALALLAINRRRPGV
jgi:sulfatase modifying factor 1